MVDKKISMDFEALVSAIQTVHSTLQQQTGKAINLFLTLRNWAIGCYIREYEQNGVDRATYGEALLQKLSKGLKNKGLKRVAERELRRYRQFYLIYPQIRETLSPEYQQILPADLLQISDANRETVSPELKLPGPTLISKFSFSHLAELMAIDDPLKRIFYEVECLHGNWSVRELRRQIGSLYFERSGLSGNKAKLAQRVQAGAEKADPTLSIRDPYVFEFIGLRSKEVMGESDLEDELLDKLEDFLLELGYGFCFEARQKRLLMGETYGFVDLVFYHRVLKCHVLVELKLEPFNHENIGQLNTYVSWYKKNMMTDGDNPPIGILLCTKKDHTLVEYALAGMDNQLFVSKYQLQLPQPEELQKFIEHKVRDTENFHTDILE